MIRILELKQRFRSWDAKAFMGISVFQGVINITLMALILKKGNYFDYLFDANQRSQHSSDPAPLYLDTLPVYLAIFASAHAYQCLLAFDAVYNRNTIQIIGLCLFNLAFLLYAIFQIDEVNNTFAAIGNPDKSVAIITKIIPITIGVTEACYLYLSWKLFREFGWEIFKNLGADRRIKKMYRSYQIFICLCKFDVFFLFGFSIQFILLVLRQGDIELYLTIAAAPLTLVLLFCGFIAARREIRWLMCIFLASLPLGIAYFAYKLVRIFLNTDGTYTPARKSLTAFSGISIITLLATIAITTIVLRNFGKGLKSHLNMQRHRQTTPDEKFEGYSDDYVGQHYQLESAKSSRMSID